MLNINAQLVSQNNFKNLHASALNVMAKVGAKVKHERTRNALEDIGCIVKGEVVQFPEVVVESIVEEMRTLGKDKAEHLDPKRPRIVPHATGQSTHAHDMETDSLRQATLRDLVDATRVANALPGVVIGHPSYIPQNVPPMVRDLYALSIVSRYFPSSRGVEIFSIDTVDAFLEIGTVIKNNRLAMLNDPPFSHRAYGSSPFVFGADGLRILWKLVDSGVKKGFYVGHVMPVLGMSTPVTLAGYLISLIAEGLEAVVLHKVITGKVRFFLGGPCALDMSTMVSTQSSPESALLHLASMELSRYYGDPEPFYPYALSTDSKFPDVQAGMEKAFKILLAVAGGSRELVTGLGVLAQASVVSLPQLIIDYEFCMMIDRLLEGIVFSEEKLAEDLIIKKGIEANYISAPHTLEHFREELFSSQAFDRRALGAWETDRKGALERAKGRVLRILNEEPVEYLDRYQISEMDRIIKCTEHELT